MVVSIKVFVADFMRTHVSSPWAAILVVFFLSLWEVAGLVEGEGWGWGGW